MKKTARRWLGHSLVVVAAAALVTACADESPLAPDQSAPSMEVASSHASSGLLASAAGAPSSRELGSVDLSACGNIQPPAGSTLAFRVYAEGVQIYRWNGSTWGFEGPLAVLSADAAGKGIVGTHYAGPKWEMVSGGILRGTFLQGCTPDPNAIPWLLLGAVATGPGVLQDVAFIQRVNTEGGKAPAYAGSADEEARVPYRAEYLFYRAP